MNIFEWVSISFQIPWTILKIDKHFSNLMEFLKSIKKSTFNFYQGATNFLKKIDFFLSPHEHDFPWVRDTRSIVGLAHLARLPLPLLRPEQAWPRKHNLGCILCFTRSKSVASKAEYWALNISYLWFCIRPC